MSFAQLKKNRKSSLNKLIQATENLSGNNQKSNEDTRFWKPSVDKSGNGFAVVRFLQDRQMKMYLMFVCFHTVFKDHHQSG